jgi:hypothetical protein
VQPDPGLLHGVLGLLGRAEQSVGDPAQVRAEAFELLGERLGHGVILRCHIRGLRSVTPLDGHRSVVVTEFPRISKESVR